MGLSETEATDPGYSDGVTRAAATAAMTAATGATTAVTGATWRPGPGLLRR